MTKQLFKFAGAVLDCYDDPIFLDTAKAQSLFGSKFKYPEELDKLPDDAFAVKIAGRTKYHRRFPVYNEDITKVSCLYYENNYEDLPVELQVAVGRALSDACDNYGLSKTANVQQHAYAQPTKVVQYITKTASTINIEQEDLTKFAEDRLAVELPKMDLENRVYAATEFYKAAGEEAVSRQHIWDYVEKPVIGRLLDGALDDREDLCKSASRELHHTFSHLREKVESATKPAEVIGALLTFDKYAGFDSRYRDGLIDPYRAVYGGWQLPKIRKSIELAQLEKMAEVVDGTTGQPVAAEAARGMTVQQHLFNLQRRFPKGTESFQKAAQVEPSDTMLQKWGDNYVKARRIYFGQ